jgi:ABC-type uncharacterized transport system involved in gliding motility auxiliary subunit
MKKNEALLYSAVGIVALFLILVAVNFIISTVPARIDLTEGKLYTLSDGTKKMLRGLQTPVKLRVYISQGDASIPVQMRSFAQRVDDMVKEFRSVAGDKLVVERYNPKPDSEEEDAAQLDGIDAQQLFTGESFYLGISASQLDRKQVIPTVAPQRERLLEYDLARAIARVAIADKPVLGLMAGMPVAGTPFNPFTRQGSDPWVLATELKRDFNVKEVNVTATSIDKDINVLLLIHPKDFQESQEYVLDQFVMRGGKLIVFVDPLAYFDQGPPQMPGMPSQPGTASNLPKLFKAWGLEMQDGKVLADVKYASGAGQRLTPTVLTLNRDAFDRNDVVTSQIETLLYAFGGAFDSKPVEGLKKTVLVKSSKTSMFVDNIVASVSGDAAMKGFVASDKEYPLALRITGKFRSAFPEGKPKSDAPPPKEPAKAKPEAPDAPHLAAAASENSLIVVADVDMLADGAAVDIQDVFGRKVVVPSNGNLAFAQGMVEQFSAGDTLISLASRTASFRPLTVVREMEAQAQQQYLGKLKALEDDLQKTTERLQELQKARGAAASKGAQILSAEQQAELENFRKRAAQSRIELKVVRKELRQDAESLVFWTKVANIALMPFLVMLVGIGVALSRRRKPAAATA